MQITGRYQLIEELRNLGESSYHKALDRQGENAVVVRIINLSQMGAVGEGLEHLAADKLRRKMENEKRLLDTLKIEHPNLLRMLDIGFDEPIYFQVYDAFTYESLKMRLERNSCLELKSALRLMLELVDVLGYLHDKGIVHCDVTPENILLGEKLKLIEFTIANHEQVEGAITGTLPYLSPETIRGARPMPSRDAWGVGVCLYEALTGELPFGDTDAGIPALFQKILGEAPRAITQNLPVAAHQLLDDLLTKDPHQRLSDMPELKTRLNQILIGI